LPSKGPTRSRRHTGRGNIGLRNTLVHQKMAREATPEKNKKKPKPGAQQNVESRWRVHGPPSGKGTKGNESRITSWDDKGPLKTHAGGVGWLWPWGELDIP